MKQRKPSAILQIQQKTVQQGTETKVQGLSGEEYVPARISNYSINNLIYV